MRFAKESKEIIMFFISIMLLSLVAIIVISQFYNLWWIYVLLAIPIFCSIFVIWSFRDPQRIPNLSQNGILAPADGIVTEITAKEKGLCFVIRMSPFDVHMTRSPLNGTVRSVKFQKGKHWPAYFSNYVKKNQRNTIVINNVEKNVSAELMQVSGIFARRTISYVKEGDKIKQGDVIGTIRFGSIVSIEIKGEKSYKLLVKPKESVRAGLSVMAIVDG